MKSFVFAFIALCAAAVTFSGNVSYDEGAADFTFRHTTLDKKTAVGIVYTSVSADGKAQDGDASVSADAFVGLSLAGAPSVVLARLTGSAAASLNTDNINANFEASLGASAMSYLLLQEVDPDGKPVMTYTPAGTWSEVVVDDAELGLRHSEMTAKLFGNDGTVKYTLVTSDVLGRVDLAGAIVAPKTIEMLVQIQNYEYVDKENHLELTVLAGALNAKADGTALVSGGDDGMYVTFSSECYSGSKKKGVIVHEFSESSKGLDFSTAISASLNIETRQVKIEFEPGLENIDYDPAVGHGTLVYGAAAGLFPSIMLLFAIFAMLLF